MAVSQDLFISLLNPVLSIVLSTAFFVLWSFRRENRYVLQLCICYLAVAIGFTLQSFDLGAGLAVSKVISNFLFFGALLLFVAAVATRQGVRVPWVASLVCIAAGMGGLLWFLFVQPYFPGRVFSVNYGLGALCIIAVMRLRQSSRRSVIDRMIVLMAGLRAADFFIRPLLVALLSGVDAGRPPYLHSPYWLTTSLSVMVFSLLIALTLLTAVALDTINELQAESETDGDQSGSVHRGRRASTPVQRREDQRWQQRPHRRASETSGQPARQVAAKQQLFRGGLHETKQRDRHQSQQPDTKADRATLDHRIEQKQQHFGKDRCEDNGNKTFEETGSGNPLAVAEKGRKRLAVDPSHRQPRTSPYAAECDQRCQHTDGRGEESLHAIAIRPQRGGHQRNETPAGPHRRKSRKCPDQQDDDGAEGETRERHFAIRARTVTLEGCRLGDHAGSSRMTRL